MYLKGGILKDSLAPEAVYIGACVLICVLVGGILRDSLAPEAGCIRACVLTCALGGILRDTLAPEGGYIVRVHYVMSGMSRLWADFLRVLLYVAVCCLILQLFIAKKQHQS